jgi:hypothetical protein
MPQGVARGAGLAFDRDGAAKLGGVGAAADDFLFRRDLHRVWVLEAIASCLYYWDGISK